MRERTGRTTLMLEDALRQVRAGRKVAVVVHASEFVRYCRALLERDLHATRAEVERLIFIPATSRPGALNGQWVHDVLVDHAVWDRHIRGAWDVVNDARCRIAAPQAAAASVSRA